MKSICIYGPIKQNPLLYIPKHFINNRTSNKNSVKINILVVFSFSKKLLEMTVTKFKSIDWIVMLENLKIQMN
jgi:hypothetical protein